MTKKILNQLILKSYKKGVLDQKSVETISKSLKRSEFKQYLKALKNTENKKSVIVASAFSLKQKDKKVFENIFFDKEIIYNVDESLILGLKIISNDLVYEMNLKNRLNNLLSYLNEDI